MADSCQRRATAPLPNDGTFFGFRRFVGDVASHKEMTMTWGKGALLWLIGIPLPIIILLALFWR